MSSSRRPEFALFLCVDITKRHQSFPKPNNAIFLPKFIQTSLMFGGEVYCKEVEINHSQIIIYMKFC